MSRIDPDRINRRERAVSTFEHQDEGIKNKQIKYSWRDRTWERQSLTSPIISGEFPLKSPPPSPPTCYGDEAMHLVETSLLQQPAIEDHVIIPFSCNDSTVRPIVRPAPRDATPATQ